MSLSHVRTFGLLCLLLVVSPHLRADELLLKDGQKFIGRLVDDDGTRIIFRIPERRLVYSKSRVLACTPGPSVFDEYDAQCAAGRNSLEHERTVALWCEEHGFLPEQAIHARNMLQYSVDDPIARRLLGHVRHDGRWMTRDEALVELGWKKRGDRWVSPDELAKEKAEALARDAHRKLERRLNELVQLMFGPSAKTAERAKADLLELGRKESIAGLAPLVERLYADARDARSVMLDVRLQHAQLQGIRTRSLSLGQGSPVTIELPESRVTSLGTTVVVPVR